MPDVDEFIFVTLQIFVCFNMNKTTLTELYEVKELCGTSMIRITIIVIYTVIGYLVL